MFGNGNGEKIMYRGSDWVFGYLCKKWPDYEQVSANSSAVT